MDEIVDYLQEDKLPGEREHTRKVKYRAEKFLIYNGKLYKRGISTALL